MGLLASASATRLTRPSLVDSDLSRLSKGQHDALGGPANEVFVSAVTAWELGIKQSRGKLSLTASIRELTDRFGFTELTITSLHGERAASLPAYHKDSFDRMLIAQAVTEDMSLVSADVRLASYAGLIILR